MPATTTPAADAVGDDYAGGLPGLPGELAAVDALLDDPVFLEPYRTHSSLLAGRSSIPIEIICSIFDGRPGAQTWCGLGVLHTTPSSSQP